MNARARAEAIKRLNDSFRQSLQGGRVLMTSGISALSRETRAAILSRVREFTIFTKANDPHGEHDFGNFEEAGHKVYWKIDYYDSTMTYGSEDPTDPAQTTRVLTIMLAEEY